MYREMKSTFHSLTRVRVSVRAKVSRMRVFAICNFPYKQFSCKQFPYKQFLPIGKAIIATFIDVYSVQYPNKQFPYRQFPCKPYQGCVGH